MKRIMSRKKLCADNNLSVNISSVNARKCVSREASLVDDYYHEVVSDGVSTSVFVSDPIYMLFNQERLMQEIGSGAVKIWLDSLTQSNDSYSELRSMCSDSELLYMVKSRHIQSLSELKSWFDYMSENVDKFNNELEQIRQSIEPIENNVEPSKTD